jgi:hypothetical protein
MIRAFNKATAIVFVIFLIVTAIAWTYEFLYAMPRDRCEKAGGWWAPKWRACGAPVDLSKVPKISNAAPGQTAPPVPAGR